MKTYPIEKLREIFSVGGDGSLIRISTGKPAGFLLKGYLCVKIGESRFLNHRIVFALTHGRWPAGGVDHANLVKTDNRPCNLREATHAENMQNRAAQARNTSGFKGVSWQPRRGKWYAYIRVNGKQKNLGSFDTAGDAAAAYAAASLKFHKEFARACK